MIRPILASVFLVLFTGSAFADPEAIRGRVRFAGPPSPPSPISADVNPETCGKASPLVGEELIVAEDGGLANVAVMLVGITERAPQRRGALLEQRNCTFVPHLQTVTLGSPLAIGNDDPIVHNVHARLDAETVFNLGMPLQGTKITRRLDRPGVISLSCDSGHTWMRAFLVVVPHSYHATTKADGRFVITGVAPGTYTLRAWHERLGVQDVGLTVSAETGAEVEVTYGGSPSSPEPMPLVFSAPITRVDEVGPGPSLPEANAAPSNESALIGLRAQRAADAASGVGLFRRYCAACHGDLGNGRGEAARHLRGRPRDFTKGELKLRSTPSGEMALTEDLIRTISVGIPGTDMPAFVTKLSLQDRRRLARYVMTFSDRFLRPAAEPLEIPPEPANDRGSINRGRTIFTRMKCAQCHGPGGSADGVSKAMVDDFGQPIAASDLTLGVYKSGTTPADLYRTLITGLSGTPMPAFADLLGSDELWDLVHYLMSLAGDRGLRQFLGLP